MPGPTGLNLLQLMERRLDSVVYRLHLARTRPMARQLVSHGHVLVDGNRVTIPSFLVRPGEFVELTENARKIPVVQEEIRDPGVRASWLEAVDAGGLVTGYPRREDIDSDISEHLIVEFYAR
jgi:small subunit ribosomal protein S4